MDDQAVRSLFTKRGKKMGIHQNSPLIDVAEVRKLHALTGDALVTKQANDEALAKIIKGEDKRILLVIGPCSSDNEEAVSLTMLTVWQTSGRSER